MRRLSARSGVPMVVLLLLASCGNGSASSSTATGGVANGALSSAAHTYLITALDFLKAHYIKTQSVDWTTVYNNALAQAAGAQMPSDTWDALRSTFRGLGDAHSVFFDPNQLSVLQMPTLTFGIEVYEPVGKQQATIVAIVPNGPADKVGLRVGDVIMLNNGFDPTHANLTSLQQTTMTILRPGQSQPISVRMTAEQAPLQALPSAQTIAPGIGLLTLPEAVDDTRNAAYASTAQSILAQMAASATHTCGLIVDLRATDGSIPPILASIAPLVSTTTLLEEDGATTRTPWTYQNGELMYGTTSVLTVSEPSPPPEATLPVAILTGPLTSFGGEAGVLAFHGQAATRVFGEPTSGNLTAPVINTLSDKAEEVVNSATIDARVPFTTMDKGLTPDQVVPIDWSRAGTTADPVAEAAIAWLRSAGCAD